MFLQVKCSSWERIDNNGMFDYIDTKTRDSIFTVEETGRIYRHITDFSCRFVKLQGHNKLCTLKQYEPLALIKMINGCCKIYDQNQTPEALCFVCPNQQSLETKDSVEITQRDLIRAGKAQIQVINITRKKSQFVNHYDLEMFSVDDFSVKQISMIGPHDYCEDLVASEVEDLPVCRYCLSRTVESNNFLINLCKCQGSTKYTHIDCLAKWIHERACIKVDNLKGVICGQLRGFTCEICKGQFPIQKLYPFMMRGSLFQQYAILKVNTAVPLIYILNLSHNDRQFFTLGRSNECDVIVSDLSVSRKHLKFVYDAKPKILSVVDLKSKFGTILKVKKQRKDSLDQVSEYQKGRTVIQIVKKKKKGFFSRLGFCSGQEDLSKQTKKLKK